jgi:hypothetical protein
MRALRNSPGGARYGVGMTFRLMLPITLLAALLVAPAAEAKYRVGIGEQNPAMFDSSRWESLKLKRVRYIVPWDWNKQDFTRFEVANFMSRARSERQDVLVTFTAHRGCFNGRRYSRSRACKAPSKKKYRKAVKQFDNAYPWVRTYSAWNEVNHVSQPTFKKPGLAVRYYDVLRKLRKKRRFKVMAADVLDTSNMKRYLRKFMRKAKGSPRLWGLHNYQDVNRKTSQDTRRMLDTVPGEVWLTETGGIVKFLPSFKRSPKRANKRTKWMFKLANRYDSRRSGMRSKITRLFVYKWFGESRSARFDAGLVNPSGSPRKAYRTFKRHARRHR